MRKYYLFLVLGILMFVQPGISQNSVFEGKESKYQNQDFYEVRVFPQKFKSKTPKNVILLIGDGMGVAQLYAGATANRGQLYLNNFKHIGFSRTQSANKYVTDSGAGGTAIATGHKANNLASGVDANEKPVPSILAVAQQDGLATGIVVTTSLLDATPAAFVAHVPNRNMSAEIAEAFVASNVDVFIGGGIERFKKKDDQRDLLKELSDKGYQVCDNMDDVLKVRSGKLAGFIPESRISQRGTQLAQTTEVALDILDNHKKGFFLMVEASEIDGGGHDNDMQYTVEEMLDFDKAIGKALEFAAQDGNTLVVVTADHETGGLTLVGGDRNTGLVSGRFTTGGHTGIMVPVFAFGPGAAEFAGLNENTFFFDKFLNLLRLKKQP